MFGGPIVECPFSRLPAGRGRKPMRTAIVNAVNDVALLSARDATTAGLIDPVLIGDFAQIQAAAEGIGWDIGIYHVIEAADEDAAAIAGAMAAGRGDVNALMKGHLHTDTFMRAVLYKEARLRMGKPLPHVSHVTLPGRSGSLSRRKRSGSRRWYAPALVSGILRQHGLAHRIADSVLLPRVHAEHGSGASDAHLAPEHADRIGALAERTVAPDGSTVDADDLREPFHPGIGRAVPQDGDQHDNGRDMDPAAEKAQRRRRLSAPAAVDGTTEAEALVVLGAKATGQRLGTPARLAWVSRRMQTTATRKASFGPAGIGKITIDGEQQLPMIGVGIGLRRPRPPNRTGGFPAYGSPVGGFLVGTVSLT